MFKSFLSFVLLSQWRAKRRAKRVAEQEALQEARLAKRAGGTAHAFGPQVAMRLVRIERARARKE